MQPEEPLALSAEFEVCVIELIPPVHRRVYKMGLEHVGVVIGYEGFSHVESWNPGS
jgi:hypothetical protein